jgi:hypothetical protein
MILSQPPALEKGPQPSLRRSRGIPLASHAAGADTFTNHQNKAGQSAGRGLLCIRGRQKSCQRQIPSTGSTWGPSPKSHSHLILNVLGAGDTHTHTHAQRTKPTLRITLSIIVFPAKRRSQRQERKSELRDRGVVGVLPSSAGVFSLSPRLCFFFFFLSACFFLLVCFRLS